MKIDFRFVIFCLLLLSNLILVLAMKNPSMANLFIFIAIILNTTAFIFNQKEKMNQTDKK